MSSIEVEAVVNTQQVRSAARTLVDIGASGRSQVLKAIAESLLSNASTILSANLIDVEGAKDGNASVAIIDRLMLTSERIQAMAAAVSDVADLPDPLGEVLLERTLENGLQLKKIRVPFGVVCVVYEARPNVTADAAAIAIKTGNGIVLRGSTQATHSNSAIVDAIHEALMAFGVPQHAVTAFDPVDKEGFLKLIADEDALDLVIPRGGEKLKKLLYEHSRVPVLAAAGGNCHVYVDASADESMARSIVLNAKTQRPGVCNACETLLIHKSRVDDLLPLIKDDLAQAGVKIVEGETGWATEFLDLAIGMRVVDSVDDAIEHINRWGTLHSEAIVTADEKSADRFIDQVDAAAVYVNASTRFTDGGVYGMGAEVGISTNKLHARGPIGLEELTTTKYVCRGSGQIRE